MEIREILFHFFQIVIGGIVALLCIALFETKDIPFALGGSTAMIIFFFWVRGYILRGTLGKIKLKKDLDDINKEEE